MKATMLFRLTGHGDLASWLTLPIIHTIINLLVPKNDLGFNRCGDLGSGGLQGRLTEYGVPSDTRRSVPTIRLGARALFAAPQLSDAVLNLVP